MEDVSSDFVASFQAVMTRDTYLERYKDKDSASYDEKLALLQNNADDIKDLAGKWLEFLDDPDKSLDELLYSLLIERLEFLGRRTQRLDQYFACRDRNAFQPPTIASLRQSMTSDDLEPSFTAQLTENLYHILQQLIQATFDSLEVKELSKNTIRALTMSPQLWPLLSHETETYGSVDHCGGYAPLLFLFNRLPARVKHGGEKTQDIMAKYVWPFYEDPGCPQPGTFRFEVERSG
jgi:hypothetical protein